MRIIITFKNGTKRVFEERGRPGGSYSQKLEYQPGFVVVVDEWGARTSIPTDTIAEIEQESPTAGRW